MLDLTAAGLSDTEAKCYEMLLKRREWQPAELAKVVNLSRTNCYKVLDKLITYELAERIEIKNKWHYRASNPSRLLQLARTQRELRNKAEKDLENNAQDLISTYFTVNEQPGVSYFQGEAELKDIYLDQIKTQEPIYIIRPDYNMDIYDFSFMTEIRHMARKAGIKRYAITPDRPKAPKNYKLSDPYMILDRTWLPANEYTSPVEWNAYGNKVAIISFGNEAIGMIIESPQIAEAFRQLYKIMADGIKRQPGYSELPKIATYIGDIGKN